MGCGTAGEIWGGEILDFRAQVCTYMYVHIGKYLYYYLFTIYRDFKLGIFQPLRRYREGGGGECVEMDKEQRGTFLIFSLLCTAVCPNPSSGDNYRTKFRHRYF
jgi:hypothetical protein